MNAENWATVLGSYIEGRRESKPDKWPTPADWLDDAARRAKQISLVTHAPKYTHGDAKGAGALVQATAQSDYLHTASLHHAEADFIGNAAALDVANLLLLEVAGQPLFALLRSDDASALQSFTSDEQRLKQWLTGLKLATETAEPVSHTLAKQVYFPVAAGSYHLLSPLFASSLVHALHQRIDNSRYSEEAKAARQARKEQSFHPQPVTEFIGLAEMHFGGTKPQNVSLLNSKRLGKAYLLNCQSPAWQQQVAVPTSEDHFWRFFRFYSRRSLRELSKFLQIQLSHENNASIKQQRADLVSIVIGQLHHFSASLRTLTPGWSDATALPVAYRSWLDTGFSGESQPDWQQQIGLAFGRWLNGQLRNVQLQMGDAELSVWRKQVSRELKLLMQDLEGWL